MAEVVLFHHVLGLTDGVAALGDEIGRAGHRVHLPDLFDGKRFDSIDAGVEHVDTLGISTIIERGGDAVEELPPGLVYCGVSLGVLPAQQLAQTRTGAAGAALLEACVPPDEFGSGWPDGVPVQIHGMAEDPFFAGEGDLDAARDLVDSIGDSARAELFVYPGDRHLFVDRSIASYDAPAAGQVIERLLQFLMRIDQTA